ncbi:sugar ABC transporter substrate-binding protein [Rhodospirillales bacterium TMPK1]|uniref:Sugar ABC transporter substrate-binding protein n=2 Tax=Roseiterribacter gracilis TaxID=2812848 RepID=A0A8S8X878_9PROT|nr:sugar ABC transporter substrate-binding protein [Rhodospirillales bacterium TMPK1]
MPLFRWGSKALGMVLGLVLAGCASQPPAPLSPGIGPTGPTADYLIGPGDVLGIYVFRAPELTVDVPVRPDGRISIPLVEDLVAVGKTPTQLTREIEGRLAKYVQQPTATVIVKNFVGPFDQQVRVVGEATKPQAIPYRANMTALDAMIEAGGLTKYAAGNRAVLVRREGSSQNSYTVRLDDLLRDGDVKQNVALRPGDVLIIPQAWF